MCLRGTTPNLEEELMNQVSATTVVRSPIARVWETIADVGSIADWHPGVERSPVLSPNRTGLGATRRVELYNGSTAVEEVTSQDEGRSVTVLMSEHTMPMKYAAATFEVKADGDDRTLVTFSMDYEMKYGPVGWLINALMLRGILNKLFPSVLDGLDHHLLTGEQIGQT
jgi:ribosome-associated toxin RatA of RatAB toxin-antitoxin module